jgi:hypothetical protein
MGYGFVFAYLLTLLLGFFIPNSNYPTEPFTILSTLSGLIGGLFPDIDRLEEFGLSHRKTLHYPLGYGLLTIITIVFGHLVNSIWIIGLSCFFAGAWLHSFMDIFDGFWIDVEKGVYEHITGRWIKPLDLIPFATTREWSLQLLSGVLAISISPQLPTVGAFPGWSIATCSFFGIWLLSTIWEFRRTVPRRIEMETQALKKMGLQPRYRRL